MISRSQTFNFQQRGMVLLISLVLILFVTVLSVAALRSTMFGIKNTALLQKETQAYHLLNAELVAQLDKLFKLKMSNNAAFEIKMDAIHGTAGVGNGGFEVQDIIHTSLFVDSKVLETPTVTIFARHTDDDRLGLGIDITELPHIQKSMCPSDSSNSQKCYNFIVVVQATLKGSDAVLQQISGFGLPDASLE